MLQVRPNISHLNEIHNWLQEEWHNEQKGFFCHWQKIKEAFKNGELLTLEIDGQAAGLIVFTENESTWIIDLAEIKPTERNNGIGSEFINQAITHFKNKGSKILKVYCSPRSSEPFWKKMGFNNSDDSLIELGTPLEMNFNASLNVNPSLISVSFP